MRVAVEEVLGLGVAVELDQDAVRIDEIPEVLAAGAVARRGRPLASGALLHLRHRQELVPERRQAGMRHPLGVVRPGEDGQEAEPLTRGIERRQPLVQGETVGARAGRPERALRDGLALLRVEPPGRLSLDLRVQQVDAIRRERRHARNRRPLAGGPERRPPVEGAFGIDRVDVDVVEARRWKRRRARSGAFKRKTLLLRTGRSACACDDDCRRKHPRRPRHPTMHRLRFPLAFPRSPGRPPRATPPPPYRPPAGGDGSGRAAGRRCCRRG